MDSLRQLNRRGLNLVEVLVASILLGLVAIPLFDVFGNSLRTTHATINEVLAANFAAEMADQLETVPFSVINEFVGKQGRNLNSKEGTLKPGTKIGANYRFLLARAPENFQRKIFLERVQSDWIRAKIEVQWTTAKLRPRSVTLVRALVYKGWAGAPE